MFDRHIFYPRFLILRISVHGLSLDTEIVGSWKFQWRRLPFHFCEKLNRPRFKVAIPREGNARGNGIYAFQSSSRLICRIYNRFVVVERILGCAGYPNKSWRINHIALSNLQFVIFFRGIEDKKKGNTNNCLIQFGIERRFLKIWLKFMNEFYLRRRLN